MTARKKARPAKCHDRKAPSKRKAAPKPARATKPKKPEPAERSIRVIVKIEHDRGGGLHGETSLAWRRLPHHEALCLLSTLIERALVNCGGKRIWKPHDSRGWQDMPKSMTGAPLSKRKPNARQLDLNGVTRA